MRSRLLVLTVGTVFTSFGLGFSRVSASLPAQGKNGMVVTSQRYASEVGLQILQEGGNAVDAAVAVGYALAVVDPCCGNIGGGGFMTIHLANGKNTFIDFREKAPLAATPKLYLDKNGNVLPGLSTNGYLAVGVPGTVLGLDRALSEYGTMSRQRLMLPAIRLAEQGFILQPGDVNILSASTARFAAQPNVAAIFLKNNQAPYRVGDRLIQKNLANTLKLIATQGPQVFYKGPIAAQLVQASQVNKGILTKEDLANYTVEETQPVSCSYRGYKLISSPPPGSGTTLCEMLNVLEGYSLLHLGFRSATSVQRILETMLYAYADRNTYLGDPDFIQIPLDRLLSKDYAASIRAKIPNSGATPPCQVYSCDTTTSEGNHTTHYSIVDRYGNAVAVTYTINSYFGAKVIAGSTGFFLNNEMDDFTSKPGVPNSFGLVQGSNNAIKPGKRPLSSMSPTIIFKNGKVFMVTGSPGGSRIITIVLEVITNVIDYGFNIQDAVNTPRFHYQGLPNSINFEQDALPSDTVQTLSQEGFSFKRQFPIWDASESILVDPTTRVFYGANDKRTPAGAALGY
ncbi:MAG: gamma-glutamyltransferase [Chroococcidiopsidaceae cyanobacterium CP_BM_RX_35]|nr:gamma-glutamyltransferase [Chroococcidiopsidaceae cyanobacterium CP_BM_RX_35]